MYIDNFYTSPILVKGLYDRGVHLGCIRIEVPDKISSLKKELSRKYVSHGAGSYVRDKLCVYTVWKDTKCVSIMSNKYPGHSESKVTRNVKDKHGKNEEKKVPIPIIVYTYNRFMNGVDRSETYKILQSSSTNQKILEDFVSTLH